MLSLPAPKQPIALLPAVASRKVRIFSFGGGVQSHAVLALQAAGKLRDPFDVFVFANVGHDSENPATLAYIEQYTKPFCEKYGIKFIQVQRQRGRGTKAQPDTIWQRIHRDKKSVVIPMRMGGNGAPGNRTCTEDFKIAVIERFAKQTYKPSHVVSGLGISVDEFTRARSTDWHDKIGKRKIGFWNKREYPLIDLRLNRQDCKRIISAAGLPEPPKSSCFFCPFKKRSEWLEMKREQPDLFSRAVEMETHINEKRQSHGKDAFYLHPSLVPLGQAVGDQPLLFSPEVMDACESGYCLT